MLRIEMLILPLILLLSAFAGGGFRFLVSLQEQIEDKLTFQTVLGPCRIVTRPLPSWRLSIQASSPRKPSLS